VVNARAQPFYCGEETQYPLYRRLGGPQGWSGWVWKFMPAPGFNPQPVLPVASCCNDCVGPAYCGGEFPPLYNLPGLGLWLDTAAPQHLTKLGII